MTEGAPCAPYQAESKSRPLLSHRDSGRDAGYYKSGIWPASPPPLRRQVRKMSGANRRGSHTARPGRHSTGDRGRRSHKSGKLWPASAQVRKMERGQRPVRFRCRRSGYRGLADASPCHPYTAYTGGNRGSRGDLQLDRSRPVHSRYLRTAPDRYRGRSGAGLDQASGLSFPTRDRAPSSCSSHSRRRDDLRTPR